MPDWTAGETRQPVSYSAERGAARRPRPAISCPRLLFKSMVAAAAVERLAREHAVVERHQERSRRACNCTGRLVRPRIGTWALSAHGVRAGSQPAVPAARRVPGHSVSLQSCDLSRMHPARGGRDPLGCAVSSCRGLRHARTTDGLVSPSRPSTLSSRSREICQFRRKPVVVRNVTASAHHDCAGQQAMEFGGGNLLVALYISHNL